MKTRPSYTTRSVRNAKLIYLSLLICLVIFQIPMAQIKAGIVPSAQQVRNFTGSAQTRLVFVNGIDSTTRYLYYVDFSETAPVIHKIAATHGAWNPSISPDGNSVAYSIGAEGSATIAVWICQLAENATPVLVTQGHAHEPRFVKDTASSQLVSTTTWQAGDWNGLGQTMVKNVPGSVPAPMESILYAQGSFHCGLSVDKRYLATTMFEPNPRMVDVTTGTVYTLHSLLCKNKTTQVDTIINPQTCNGSISSSGIFTNVMMYEDYGIPVQYTHQTLGYWGFHKRLFISSSQGDIIRWYDFPDSLMPVSRANVTGCRWTHSEWSVNHPYYGVASNITSRIFPIGSDFSSTDLCEDLYAINLRTATYLKLVESTDNSLNSATDLQWPGLWIGLPASFAEDSTWLTRQSPIRKNPDARARVRKTVWISGHSVFSTEPVLQLNCFNPAGKLILGKKYNGRTYSIRLAGNVSAGTYILEVTTGSGIQVLRYLQER
jgi:hypothetical protein